MQGSSWSQERQTLHTWVLGAVPSLGCLRPCVSSCRAGTLQGPEGCRGRRALLGLPWEWGLLRELPPGLGEPPDRKGLDQHLAGAGVVLCYGPEFCFLSVRIKYELFPLQPWGSSTCWEELSQVLDGCELCSFPALLSMSAVGFICLHWGMAWVKAVKNPGLPISAVGSHLGCFMLQ